MGNMNLADCLDQVARVRGDAEALVQASARISWTDVERRAAGVAAWLVERGCSHQGKLALYTTNHPAYMEAVYAGFKAALVPVNVNYRYREDELLYLLENADAEAVVVHEDFLPRLARVRDQLPKLRAVLVVGDTGSPSTAALPEAVAYDEAASHPGPAPDRPRSPDDLMFLYTGGTTGMPKGVMWRQGDLYQRFGGGGLAPAPPDMDAFCAWIENPPQRLRTLIGPPLMHGTGWFTAMIAWLTGGAVILLDDPKRFDATGLWDVVHREKPTAITIVGDSFGKPMLAALRESPGRFDLSSIAMIASSGVMWSQETKQGLLEHHPSMALVDSFSSSEAVGMGMSVTTAAGTVATAKFQLSDTTRLFDEQLQPLETRPGVRGLVGVGGPQPVGYYKDAEKSARTFVPVGEHRFSIPGDWAEVNPDGVTLTLLGRGSVCINTGGEKVFPEEVEEVLKRHPGVRDAVVVGVPDDKFGEAVTAVVSVTPEGLSPGSLPDFVKEKLAGYKAPRQVVVVSEVYRSPSGKADFKRTRATALAALGIEA
ncbi:MAG: AMP-binding protein [Proteobacteria bacterium]|nr:AMP-binding protein [Pseudomonadota bacterium]